MRWLEWLRSALGLRVRDCDRKKLEYECLKDAAEGERKKNICFSDLMKLITTDWHNYLKADGHYSPHTFINTCVLDSFLVGLHFCRTKYDTIEILFQSDLTLHSIMKFLDAKRYNEAKALWLINLNLLSEDCKFNMSNDIVDVWSEVNDHLPMFNFPECQPNHGADDCMPENAMREFRRYGEVIPLGKKNANLCFVLINVDGCMDNSLQHHITKYERTFELQFLLLQKKPKRHIVVCCNLVDRWVLYDSDPKVAPDENFNFESVGFKNDYSVYLAGYVSITQPGQRNVGVPVSEEGVRTNNEPTSWNWKPK